VKIRAYIDGRVVELSAKVMNYEMFEKLGCKPVVYPYAVCCEKPNPRAERLDLFCDTSRLQIMRERPGGMMPMIDMSREFLKALLNPSRVKLVTYSKSPGVVVVRVDYAGYELWVYRRKGLWSIGTYYAVRQVIESWCKDLYRTDCRIYPGVTLIAAVLEDYVIRLSTVFPEILIPSPHWHKEILQHSIRIYPQY